MEWKLFPQLAPRSINTGLGPAGTFELRPPGETTKSAMVRFPYCDCPVTAAAPTAAKMSNRANEHVLHGLGGTG